MTQPARDRLADLLRQGHLSGIDFVELTGATTFNVHFLTDLRKLSSTGSYPVLQASDVKIVGGETIASVSVLPIGPNAWSQDPQSGNTILVLSVSAPGDFSTYQLTINSSVLDEYFATVPFSFKALCPATIDCITPAKICPAEPVSTPPIEYLAKDFQSFRQALSDFSALQYPEWQERSEADFGVMFMEALCAIADDLSYQQDRVAAQCSLDSATERRSLVRLARLVDYEPRAATAARVDLKFTVTSGPIPAGLLVSATTPDGTPIEFETGTGLNDMTNYDVRPEWNCISPWWFDDSKRCLPQGATEIWVQDPGHQLNLAPGQRVLIDTAPVAGDAPVRQVVTITAFVTDHDDVYNQDVARIEFGANDQLVREHDLTRTMLSANLVPATQGRRCTETFAIDDAREGLPIALVRTGPNQTTQYLYPLKQGPLAWLAPANDVRGAPATPEIQLIEGATQQAWTWLGSLLGADLFAKVFTVDPVLYSPVGVPNQDGGRHWDYDGSAGATIRFGDGTFGELPEGGSILTARYCVGGGDIGNVAADSITRIDAGSTLAMRASAVTNPFQATGGADQETDESVRRLAPQVFRATQFRAVRPEDYSAAAETLATVQRAGTAFRYTGSWLTAFTSVETLASESPSPGDLLDAIVLLNRYRMAGYESYVLPPRYVSLDLQVSVCARADAFRADVAKSVRDALSSNLTAAGEGFFHHDRFAFGEPLERSELEAAIQNAYGVDGIVSIQYRRRGGTAQWVEMLPGVGGTGVDQVPIGPSEIIRVDGDPSRPDAGSVTVTVGGGK
jgi:hypothetical protein